MQSAPMDRASWWLARTDGSEECDVSSDSASQDAGITRRGVLQRILAAGAVVAAPPFLHAGQMQTHMPPGAIAKARGPVVFLDYDKEELDASYNQGPWSPNAAEIRRQIGRASCRERV